MSKFAGRDLRLLPSMKTRKIQKFLPSRLHLGVEWIVIKELLQQLETAMAEKESQADRWEFPRHRLKVFHILGEGCFGQVWKCEAIDIDGELIATALLSLLF
jgi:hypothetical protein